MVLWEITVATAYFLGLRRTYRLALKIQRRLISPKYPKIRRFSHRRTRAVFDIALKVHRNIQRRNIEVGRSLGNRILRLLDRMKPSVNICGDLQPHHRNTPSESRVTPRQAMEETQKYLGRTHQKSSPGSSEQGPSSFSSSSDMNLFSAAKSMSPFIAAAASRSFPMMSMMRQPPRLTLGLMASCTSQFRHFSVSSYGTKGPEGLFRQDILLWMKSN